MGKIEITREKFLAYEEVRESGAVNMFDFRAVCMLSDYILSVTDCRFIIDHYDSLEKKYKRTINYAR